MDTPPNYMPGFAALGSGLGSLFGSSNDPYKSASKIIGGIPQAVNPYIEPYAAMGMQAWPQLQKQYASLINDPGALYNKIASGYQQSPGYKWQLGQGMEAAKNAAAAGGMLGSPQHQQQAATMAEGLANQDYYNYMQNALGSAQNMYGAGLHGLQGIGAMGYGASDQLARIIADTMSAQGQMKFGQQAAQNQSQGSTWGNIFGGLAGILPFLF